MKKTAGLPFFWSKSGGCSKSGRACEKIPRNAGPGFAKKYLKATMKIAVVGAGVIGIATAYELAQDGHHVTVFDKSAAACEEASFANSGLIAPSLLIPFAAPGSRGNGFMRFLDTGRRLSRRPWRSWQQMQSLWRWAQAHRPEVATQLQITGRQLARYSAEQLLGIVERHQMEIERSDGHMVLLRTEQALQRLQPVLETLKAEGIASKVLTPDEARAQEPALHSDAPLHAALWLTGDLVMNCRQFALELKNETQKMGVQYQLGVEVQDITLQPQPVLALATPRGTETASTEHVVLCTHQVPKALLARFSLHIPTQELHGYALSVAVREPLNAPRSAIHDLHDDLLINRLGNRIRVSAGAELGSKPAAKDSKTVNAMYRALEQYFPGAANYPAGTQVWHGSRHLTRDGLPAVGPSGLQHLSLNLGHGACGWTWACGSARLLADQIGGHGTAVDAAPLLPTRFAR